MGVDLDQPEQISERNISTTIDDLSKTFRDLPKSKGYSLGKNRTDADGWITSSVKIRKKDDNSKSGNTSNNANILSKQGIAAAFQTMASSQQSQQRGLSGRAGVSVPGQEHIAARHVPSVSGNTGSSTDASKEPKASAMPSGNIFGAFSYQEQQAKESKKGITAYVNPPQRAQGQQGNKYQDRYKPVSSVTATGNNSVNGTATGNNSISGTATGKNSSSGTATGKNSVSGTTTRPAVPSLGGKNNTSTILRPQGEGTTDMAGDFYSVDADDNYPKNINNNSNGGTGGGSNGTPCEMYLTDTCGAGKACAFEHDMSRVEAHYHEVTT